MTAIVTNAGFGVICAVLALRRLSLKLARPIRFTDPPAHVVVVPHPYNWQADAEHAVQPSIPSALISQE